MWWNLTYGFSGDQDVVERTWRSYLRLNKLRHFDFNNFILYINLIMFKAGITSKSHNRHAVGRNMQIIIDMGLDINKL